MRLLVTGGAGYVGSHVVACLRCAGHEVRVLDDLSSGHADALAPGLLVRADVGDASAVQQVLHDDPVDAVVHLAALSQVTAAVREPGRFHRNNVDGTRVLLDAIREAGVQMLVFASTVAVYGCTQQACLYEDDPVAPDNPYGAGKREVERMLADRAQTDGLRSVSLRLANVAGAWPEQGLGERHEPETHLVPLACHAAMGKRDGLVVNGCSHPTPDGTCVRDYVHVRDVAMAHQQALAYLAGGGASAVVNVGAGTGHSVLDVVECVERITGSRVPLREGVCRAVDSPGLVVSTARAWHLLGWRPARSSLQRIVQDAWRWESGRQARNPRFSLGGLRDRST